MGRPRTPTNVLELRGAFKHDPQRRRDGEPEGVGEIGEPSERLTELQREAWLEVVALCPVGVLTGSDRVFVDQIAELRALQWEGSITSTDRKILIGLLGKVGMNPSDRASLSVAPKGKPVNEFADL